MCAGPSRPATPPPPPPPPPAPAPAPEQNVISPNNDRRRAIAAGRRDTQLTGSRGVLTQANVGKTLLGG